MDTTHTTTSVEGAWIGTTIAMVTAIAGTFTAQNTAYIVSILAGLITLFYTTWKWYNEYRDRHNRSKAD
jgi:4-hydroxybenzoate polyprenyltransferase